MFTIVTADHIETRERIETKTTVHICKSLNDKTIACTIVTGMDMNTAKTREDVVE